MSNWESYLAERRPQLLGELTDLLSIPSISALPGHADDVQRASEWVVSRLTAAGVEEARAIPTALHPAVHGEWLHAPGKPTVLFYGHFDVQPVDPLDLWTTPPFEPTVRDGRLYARGASDMKCGVLATIAAVEAVLKTDGSLPVNVKFLLEGQEEIGSPGMSEFVAANRELLACDVVVNADGMQWSETEPALIVATRGICGLQIDVRGPRSDLHSGIFGGAVQNPLHALAELVASLHSADGRVAVDGFYDDVVPLTADDRAKIAAVPFDDEAYRESLGVLDLLGEAGYSPVERTWARPTLELNGLWGGFQGEGSKTVLPREAHAKITCRLVPEQDPAKVIASIREYVRRHAPRGVTVSAGPATSSARAYAIPSDHPANTAASGVLADLYGRDPYYIRMGGSVPILEIFREKLGVYSVCVGFGLPDEQFHAPDEFVRIASFERAPVFYGRLLERLGAAG